MKKRTAKKKPVKRFRKPMMGHLFKKKSQFGISQVDMIMRDFKRSRMIKKKEKTDSIRKYDDKIKDVDHDLKRMKDKIKKYKL